MIDTSINSAKQWPVGGYEYVDVQFAAADQDVVVPFSKFRIERPDEIRWIDVTPREGRVYKPSRSAKVDGASYVVLRCDVENVKTRLLLFVERTE